MQPFDVDTGDELLTARRFDEDVWWNQAQKQQAAKNKYKAWLISVTVLTLLGLTISLAALGTAAVVARRSTSAQPSSSSATSSKPPGWDHIKKIAFSSCTSYDVRPQPIWTEASAYSRAPNQAWQAYCHAHAHAHTLLFAVPPSCCNTLTRRVSYHQSLMPGCG